MKMCKKVVIGLSVDIHDRPYELGQEYQLFYLTKETLWKLNKMCIDLKVPKEEDILLDTPEQAGELDFLEKHIFRLQFFCHCLSAV